MVKGSSKSCTGRCGPWPNEIVAAEDTWRLLACVLAFWSLVAGTRGFQHNCGVMNQRKEMCVHVWEVGRPHPMRELPHQASMLKPCCERIHMSCLGCRFFGLCVPACLRAACLSIVLACFAVELVRAVLLACSVACFVALGLWLFACACWLAWLRSCLLAACSHFGGCLLWFRIVTEPVCGSISWLLWLLHVCFRLCWLALLLSWCVLCCSLALLPASSRLACGCSLVPAGLLGFARACLLPARISVVACFGFES